MSDETDTLPRPDDPDLTLDRVMGLWPRTIAVFLRHRMQCVGCPFARFYTAAEACRFYGLPHERFLGELRDAAAPPAPPGARQDDRRGAPPDTAPPLTPGVRPRRD